MKLAFSFFLSLPLMAGVTFVNSASSFFPFAGPTTTQDFNSVPDGSYNTSAGLTAGGVALVGHCVQTSPGNKWCGGDYQLSASAGTITGPMGLYAYPDPPYGSQNGDLEVTLPHAVYAAGFEFTGESSTPTGRIQLLLSSGEISPIVVITTGQPGFMGFLSDTAITSFTVRVLNPGFEYSRILFDNLSYGDDAGVPEPGYGVLAGALLTALVVIRR